MLRFTRARLPAGPHRHASNPAALTSLCPFPHPPTQTTSGRSRFDLPVRREGALHQRVQVPPEELSMRLGSYRARSRSQSGRGFEAPRQKASERRLSKQAGRNASEV